MQVQMPYLAYLATVFSSKEITKNPVRKSTISSGASFFRSTSFRLALGLAIGFLLLYLTLKDLSWSEVQAQVEGINYFWVVLAVALYWLELSLRIVRWSTLLSPLRPAITTSKIAISFISGYAANNVLPAKLGEAFRADLLGRLAGVSRLTTFGSIIIERIFDMVMVLAMSAWGILFITSTHVETLSDINHALLLLGIPFAGFLLVVYFLAARRENSLVRRLKTMSEKAQNLIAGLQTPADAGSYFKLVSSTVVVWTLNCLAMWSILMALGVALDVNQTILLIGLTGIAAAIPAAPAGIGTLQYAFHLTAILFDFAPSAALVASAIVQIALLGSATVMGGIAYSYAISNHLLLDEEAQA